MLRLFAFFIFSTFAINAYCAEVKYDINNDKINFIISFTKGYSNLDKPLKSGKNIILNFESAEDVKFDAKEFFDLPISSAYVENDSYRKKFVVKFNAEAIEPLISATDNKSIKITFSFPPGTLSTNAPTDNFTGENTPAPAKTPPLPGMGAYFRMLLGLVLVLAIILVIYKLLRQFSKRQVLTDIPGTGRLLGKIELEMRRSLYFYEIADTIYIIGSTDSSISLIDKVKNQEDITKIKAGFTKKREFSGYMSFFKRKTEIDDDISVSNAMVEEKLKSLRKK